VAAAKMASMLGDAPAACFLSVGAYPHYPRAHCTAARMPRCLPSLY
jgi:hypothetical protein